MGMLVHFKHPRKSTGCRQLAATDVLTEQLSFIDQESTGTFFKAKITQLGFL